MTTHLNDDLREFASRKQRHLEAIKDLRKQASDIMEALSVAKSDEHREALGIKLDAVLEATDRELASTVMSYQLAIQTINRNVE